MKRLKLYLLFLIAPLTTRAQMDLRASLSNIILNIGFGKAGASSYSYGGAGFGRPTIALEGEWRMKHSRINRDTVNVLNPKTRTSTSIEFVLFYSHHTFSVIGYTNRDNDPMQSTFDIKVVQVPLIYKGNAHLSLLDENIRASFGIGVVGSYIIQSHLKESATDYVKDSNNNIIDQKDYSGNANTTNYGPRFFFSPVCFELSFAFKRLFIAERAWFSLQNMYMNKLPSDWAVPATHSVYLNAYQTWSKVSYGGGAFTIGWRFN